MTGQDIYDAIAAMSPTQRRMRLLFKANLCKDVDAPPCFDQALAAIAYVDAMENSTTVEAVAHTKATEVTSDPTEHVRIETKCSATPAYLAGL